MSAVCLGARGPCLPLQEWRDGEASVEGHRALAGLAVGAPRELWAVEKSEMLSESICDPRKEESPDPKSNRQG